MVKWLAHLPFAFNISDLILSRELSQYDLNTRPHVKTQRSAERCEFSPFPPTGKVKRSIEGKSLQ